MTERGLILKGVGGFYTVRTPEGEHVTCTVRGRFRMEGITPVCGDRVELERQQEGHAAIAEILERKSLLARPPVANIDQLIIVLSASVPKPDLMLCDKLLLAASPYPIEPLILINKCDTVEGGDAEAIARQYAGHYNTLTVSALTGQGLDELANALDGRISCFAGQSAVGKSSLLNGLIPGLDLPVGKLARRTARGKHTTRHAELWPYRGGAVLDTPGFSLLDLKLMDQDALNRAYREFGNAPESCRFTQCAHRSEPDCAVKALLPTGALARERYERYVELSLQLEEMRKHVYD